MMNMHSLEALILAVAEAAGACLFFTTKNSTLRTLMTSFGLGFAIAIVFFDLLPDSTEHYPIGYALFAMGAVITLGVCLVMQKRAKEKAAAGTNSIAVVGMGLHNLGEGVILAGISGALSPIFFLGALLHKLPEGMATYALLDGVKEKRRFAFAILVGLMVPMGALLRLPESVQQPVMAFFSGIILISVSAAIVKQLASHSVLPARWQQATPYVAGALIGYVSCLIA
jgi:ZIP family zinc transporter